MSTPKKPVYIIAHKDGCWGGASCSDTPGFVEFVADFVRDGFSITSFDNPEDCRNALRGMESWRHNPSQSGGATK